MNDIAAPAASIDQSAVTRRLAWHVAQTRFEDLNERAVHSFKRTLLDPKGEGENLMSDADLERKFLGNCEPIIGQEGCNALLRAVWNFDRLDNLAVFYRW